MSATSAALVLATVPLVRAIQVETATVLMPRAITSREMGKSSGGNLGMFFVHYRSLNDIFIK
jgi:hypothetical protein